MCQWKKTIIQYHNQKEIRIANKNNKIKTMMEIKKDNNPKSIRMRIKDKIVNLERNDYHYYNLS